MSFSGYNITTLEELVISKINNDSTFDYLEVPAAVEIDQLFQSPTVLVKDCPAVFVEIVGTDTDMQRVDARGRVITELETLELRLYVCSPVKKTAGGVTGITEMIEDLRKLLVGNSLDLSDIQGVSFSGAKQRVKARIKSSVANVFYLWQMNMNIKLLRKAA